MDRQKVFNKIWDHFIVQGNPRAVAKEADCFGEYKCFYKSPEGLKCAIGIFISDSNYNPEMERKSISCVFKDNYSFWQEFTSIYGEVNFHDTISMNADWIFLMKMQQIHDKSDDLSHMKNKLIEAAKQFDLLILV